MSKVERRLELGNMFLKMGDALALEGRDVKDGCILQAASTFHLLSSIVSSEEEMFIFGEFIGMFIGKKFLEDMRQSDTPKISDDFITNLIASVKKVSEKTPERGNVKKPRKPRRKKDENDEPESGS